MLMFPAGVISRVSEELPQWGVQELRNRVWKEIPDLHPQTPWGRARPDVGGSGTGTCRRIRTGESQRELLERK